MERSSPLVSGLAQLGRREPGTIQYERPGRTRRRDGDTHAEAPEICTAATREASAIGADALSLVQEALLRCGLTGEDLARLRLEDRQKVEIACRFQFDSIPYLRRCGNVKTTVDIPEHLYRQAEIRAVAENASLRDIVIRGLERELRRCGGSDATAQPVPYFARRKLLPAFARLQTEGAFHPKPSDRDITELISNDRDGR